jgi:hypothetical protein
MFHRRSLLHFFLLPSATPTIPAPLRLRRLSFSLAAAAATTRRADRPLSPDEFALSARPCATLTFTFAGEIKNELRS